MKCEPVPAVDADGWTEWQNPIMRGYKMQCCDCGLIHEVEFRVGRVDGQQPDGGWEGELMPEGEYRVQMRMRRA